MTDFFGNDYFGEYFSDGYFGPTAATNPGSMSAVLSGAGAVVAGLSEAPAVHRGGGSYLTREEMRELARRQRILDKKEREFDRDLLEIVREAHPQHKAKLRRIAQDTQDEEDLITMMLLRKAA